MRQIYDFLQFFSLPANCLVVLLTDLNSMGLEMLPRRFILQNRRQLLIHLFPHLELCATGLISKLISFIYNQISIDLVRCWYEFMIVLSWLRSDPLRTGVKYFK